MAGKKGQQDYYYYEAKRKGYRSRAAFKLLQINRKFKVIRKNFSVLDLGASPGGWSQVAVKLGADVVAVDLNPMEKMDGVHFIQGDITEDETIKAIRSIRDYYDTVICDASPKISGNWDIDHILSIELARSAFKIAKKALKPGGNFVVKIFQGSEIQEVFEEFKLHFRFCKFYSPQASRKRSSEVYFIGKGFKPGN